MTNYVVNVSTDVDTEGCIGDGVRADSRIIAAMPGHENDINFTVQAANENEASNIIQALLSDCSVNDATINSAEEITF